MSWSNVDIPCLIPTPFFNVKRRSESLIEILFSGQRGNVFSISESVLFIISIFKKDVGIR